jgi:hypothetical protein
LEVAAVYPVGCVEAAKEAMHGSMEKPNLFLIPPASPYASSAESRGSLCEFLERHFPVSVLTASPADNATGEHSGCFCVAVDSSRPEKVKDYIKEHLWTLRATPRNPTSLHDLAEGRGVGTGHDFRLEDYGAFVPFRPRRFNGIRTHSFHHRPTFYRYRLALERTGLLPVPLAEYLIGLFTSCPNHVFNNTTFRASGVSADRVPATIPLEALRDHDLQNLAVKSLGYTQVKSRHENLQKFLLERDSGTVACEVPVWVESLEFRDYDAVFRTAEPLTGHIDILRREPDGRIGIWDYKPQAAQESDAATQVFLYALMLAARAGVPTTRFVCGYFDETDMYAFNPSQARMADDV